MSNFDSALPADIIADFAAFHRRLNDISSYQLDRLRGAPSASLLQEYESELSDAFQDVEGRLKALKLASDDYDRAEEVEAVRAESQKASEALAQARLQSREALLAARRGIAARNEASLRAELSLDRDPQRKRSRLTDRSGDDKLQTASEDVTDALRRTVALMSQELEKSSFSAQMLDESSSALRTMSLEYTSFSTLLKSSTQLIKSMERQDLYDRLMVLGSLLFFLLCVGYILKVRIWDRGATLIGFLFRTFGLRGRSKEEVMISVKMAKKAAQESASLLAASASASSASLSQSLAAAATAAAAAASASISSGAAQVQSSATLLAESAWSASASVSESLSAAANEAASTVSTAISQETPMASTVVSEEATPVLATPSPQAPADEVAQPSGATQPEQQQQQQQNAPAGALDEGTAPQQPQDGRDNEPPTPSPAPNILQAIKDRGIQVNQGREAHFTRPVERDEL